MRLNKYSWLAALPMIFTACQDDTLVENQQQDKIYTLSATMDGGAVMSRAQIQLGNEDAEAGETFMWNEGDEFALFQRVKQVDTLFATTFAMNSMSEDRKSGVFTTDNPAIVNDYMAIYPSNLERDNWNIQLKLQDRLDFSAANTDEEIENVWKNYMNDNMYMLAKGTIVSGGLNELNFEHLCALARVTYTNATDETQTIEQFSFLGNNNKQSFRTSYVYNLFSNKLQGGGATTNYTIYYDGGLNVEPGDSMDLYAFLLPYEFNTEATMQLSFKANSVDKSVSMSVADIQTVNPDDTGFEAGKRYWFKVTETAEGLVWTKDYTEGPTDDETIVIENQELSSALHTRYGVTLNDDGYAVMTGAEVKGYPELQLGWSDYTITSLSGIEKFVNLEILGCAGVGLQECNLSQNKKLTYLDVSHNKLTSLDVSNNPALNNLSCSYNAAADDENDDYSGLSSLTLTNCSNLTHLSVEHTALQTLTIPNPSKLETLYLGNTNISFESFSLNGFTSLTGLDVENMNLNDLSIIPDAMKDRLTWLYCDNNNLTSLDLTQYPLVIDLHCNDNDIETLTLTDAEFKNSPLNSLYCMGNKMKALDITGTNISSLGCGKQQDGEFLQLTLSDKQKESWNDSWKSSLENIFVYLYDEEPEETITIENESFAKELKNQFGDYVILQDGKAIMTKTFAENNVTEINIWDKREVTSVEGIKNFPNLKRLVLVYNGLTSLDVSGLAKLEYLECWDGGITSINVSGCTALKELYCQYNAITELDVAGCTDITNLNCSDNKLTSLDLTACTNKTIELLCGNQGNKAGEEITITIKLTDAMKAYWKSYLINLDNNQIRVVLYGDKSVTIPSLPKEGWDWD